MAIGYNATKGASWLDYGMQTWPANEKFVEIEEGQQLRLKINPKKQKPPFPATPKFFQLENKVYTYDYEKKKLVLHATFLGTHAAKAYIDGDKS